MFREYREKIPDNHRRPKVIRPGERTPKMIKIHNKKTIHLKKGLFGGAYRGG